MTTDPLLVRLAQAYLTLVPLPCVWARALLRQRDETRPNPSHSVNGR